jgi:hypothetical protein
MMKLNIVIVDSNLLSHMTSHMTMIIHCTYIAI